MAIYMNWGNSLPPDMKGDVTESSHRGWIELFSAEIGTRRSAGASQSDQARRGPAMSEIVITKAQDSSSPRLFRESVQGNAIKVLIDFTTLDGGTPTLYLQLLLTDALVSAYSTGSGSGDNPTESITLSFTKLEWGSGRGVTPHTTAPPLFNLDP